MRFELDKTLIGEILFCMENQDGNFLLDVQEGQIIDLDNKEYDVVKGWLTEEPNFEDGERFISLPEWSSQNGFRLMERFAAGLKNPLARQELSAALNRNKGVFRLFKNVLEQYPEVEKLWYSFKEQEMRGEVIAWYNALREEWGLAPIGSEPEDTSSLVLEDFVFRNANETDREKAAVLHKLCIEELSGNCAENKKLAAVFESMNPYAFPGNICLAVETANGDFAGFIYAEKDSCALHIRALEVKQEYRGLGLGKALLSKLLEKADEQKLQTTIDLPAGLDFFSRALLLEEFKPCVQRFVR